LARPFVEPLESRTLFAVVDGFSPAQIRKAYGFDQITLGDGTVPADGQGQTIAIVDAFNHPRIASDLNVFNAQFGLPPADLTVVNQRGGRNLPETDGGWAGEIALDVEWAHAIAPAADILLVEADSNSTDDLMTAVDYARRAPGVSAISLSWGGSEFFSWGGEESSVQLDFDRTFTTPAGHQGVTFLVASGDSGRSGGVQWPASSPNVVSVGGTALQIQDNSGTYAGEGPWLGFRDGTSGGFSRVEPEPAFQQIAQQSGWRSTPDVGYNGDPETGFAVYSSVPYQGFSGWDVVGGTSAGAPQWAALVAIANQGRALAGRGTLDGPTQTLPALYSVYSDPGTSGYGAYTSSFNDIGNDGYGYTTGLGTPRAAAVVRTLIGGAGATPVPQPAILPASPLAVTFTTLPEDGIEGEDASLKLRLTNATDSRFSGPVEITLYASTDGSVSADDTVVTTIALPQVALRPDASKTVKVRFTRPTGLADGDYNLVASIAATDTNTAPARAVTPSPLRLEAPRVDLSTTFASAEPIHVDAGRAEGVSVTVRNLGNVAASGTLGVTLYASTDRALDAGDTLLAALPTRKLRLRSGHGVTLRARFRGPDGAGSYFLIAAATPTVQPLDSNASNDVAVAQASA
jgi:hypothetical protein